MTDTQPKSPVSQIILNMLSSKLTPVEVAALRLAPSGVVCTAAGFQIVKLSDAMFHVEHKRGKRWNVVCKRNLPQETTPNTL